MATLVEQLVEKAIACRLTEQSTPGSRFRAFWELYEFLNETPGLDLYLCVGQELETISPQLTEDDKQALRKLGVTFPEDWENPREFA